MDNGIIAKERMILSEYYDEKYDNAPRQDLSRLAIIDSVTLTETRCRRREYLIDGFLKPGLAVLAGAPKIGKSWLMLQLCLAVAKGEPFLNMDVRQSTVLYIDLEDSFERLQDRMLSGCEEPAENLKIAFRCNQLGEGIIEEIRGFKEDYPDAKLVVIDTFQKIRMPVGQMSYAVDYAEISSIKSIADELDICILLVHHTRKLGDSDFINEISGTNGIAGSADTLMVLKKSKRTERKAELFCTGRDIEDRSMELAFDNEAFRWRLISDSRQEYKKAEMPQVLFRLTDFMREIVKFEGTNEEFCSRLSAFIGSPVNKVHLKRSMNRFRFELEDRGVSFMSLRTATSRMLMIVYSKKHDRTLAGRADDSGTTVS